MFVLISILKGVGYASLIIAGACAILFPICNINPWRRLVIGGTYVTKEWKKAPEHIRKSLNPGKKIIVDVIGFTVYYKEAGKDTIRTESRPLFEEVLERKPVTLSQEDLDSLVNKLKEIN